MGIKRLLKRTLSPSVMIRDTLSHIRRTGSVSSGLNSIVRETVCEDHPIGKAIFEAGKHEGKKVGYSQASSEYEKKLLEQADSFIKQKKVYESELDRYEKLLDEYEAEIDKLESKVNKTEEEKKYLQQLILKEISLRKIKKS